MQQTNWFDRQFDFSGTQNIFPSIIVRLEDTPLRLEHRVKDLAPEIATRRPGGKWSIHEHIGHLTDLEALWQGRLDDILTGQTHLRPTDLTNSQVDRANYNAVPLPTLLADFRAAREHTLARISELTEDDFFKSALHPRLGTPMRVMDHFLFVAEHDDHHLVGIGGIVGCF